MASKKSPFIEGFREPTLSKNSFLVLADVRGDGEGKLVIWSQEQAQLIVYKGSNRELEKSVKLKNVSGIIQYQDEDRNAQSVIGLSSQNGFYIFRSLAQSFRLKVPDICAEPEEQMIWTQYQSSPSKIGQELLNLDPKIISETAKYYLGCQTEQRKQELIEKVFDEGINERDAISAMALMRNSDANYMGNIILGTELQRLYILDQFGHTIVSSRIIPVVPAILLGYGKLKQKYILVCIGREGDICLFMQNDQNQPSERIKNSTRITSACLSFPDLILVGADQTVTHYALSNNTFKILAQRYKMKMGSQPIKVEFMKFKGQKMTILAFEKEVRLYNQKELTYTFLTDYILYNIIWGSFARQECCLILLYENAGFQVLILHRQFKISQKYGSNKAIKQQFEDIPIPKKTPHFLAFWNDRQTDEELTYKHFEKGLKMLKWRTLRQKFIEGGAQTEHQIEINSKVLGLGPFFNIELEVQNLSKDILFNIGVMINNDKQNIELIRWENNISMLPPFTPTSLEIQVRSLSLKNESLTVELVSGKNIVSSKVFLPNCQEFGNG